MRVTRAPFEVLVFACRQVGKGEFEYALLKRTDSGYWQGIAGGGEGDETPLEAARRESNEEAGVPPNTPFIRLDTIIPVPVTEFKDSHLWGESVYVIPQYCFGAQVSADYSITLSREHLEFRWMTFEEAHCAMHYDGDKVALWELNQRLRGLGPRD
jgi:dATP pyrophosphohydrolase